MSSSLSKLVDNLSEGIHNNKCVDCKSYLDYIKTKIENVRMNFVIKTLINVSYC